MLIAFIIILLVILVLNLFCASDDIFKFCYFLFMIILTSLAFDSAIKLKEENRGLKADARYYERVITETSMNRLLAPLRETE